jgi:dimethylargininase
MARAPSSTITQCELTYLERDPIDFLKIQTEHSNYVATLTEYANRINVLPELPQFPDSVFVEDVAVAIKQKILLTRPGALSRRGEVEHFARALAKNFVVVRPPNDVYLDGGDVLQTDQAIFVGMSGRSNQQAIEYLQTYSDLPIIPILTNKCLHLKTGITYLGDDHFLINSDWIDEQAIIAHIPEAQFIDVSKVASKGANCIKIAETIFISFKNKELYQRIEDLGLQVRYIDISELTKAECGLSCLSLIINH